MFNHKVWEQTVTVRGEKCGAQAIRLEMKRLFQQIANLYSTSVKLFSAGFKLGNVDVIAVQVIVQVAGFRRSPPHCEHL